MGGGDGRKAGDGARAGAPAEAVMSGRSRAEGSAGAAAMGKEQRADRRERSWWSHGRGEKDSRPLHEPMRARPVFHRPLAKAGKRFGFDQIFSGFQPMWFHH
jgi:hypothetical protein